MNLKSTVSFAVLLLTAGAAPAATIVIDSVADEPVGTGSGGKYVYLYNNDYIVDHYAPTATITGANTIRLGYDASGNQATSALTARGAASIIATQSIQVRGASTLTVTDGAQWTVDRNIALGTLGSNGNSLVISSGGKLITGGASANYYLAVGGLNSADASYQARNNTVTITGSGSLLDVSYGLFIGSKEGVAADNTLTLSDGGTLKLSGANASLSIGTGSSLRFEDGSLALFGGESSALYYSFTTALSTGLVQIFDGTEWARAEIGDFTQTTAYYGENLYTVFTYSAVPEPASCAALAGATLLAFAVMRRRTTAAGRADDHHRLRDLPR